MLRWLIPLLFALPLEAQEESSEPLGQDLVTAAEEALHDPTADLGLLYDQAVAEAGDAEELVTWFEEQGESGEGERAVRALALAARLRWRMGDASAARALLAPLMEAGAPPRVRFLYGRLLDALGREDEARETYAALREETDDPTLQRRLGLRLALLDSTRGGEQKDALADLARQEGQPASFRRRAAVALALLGRPKDALEIYVPTEERGTPLFRDLVRLADWALRAADAPAAQDYAWRASLEAQLSRDRAYALTLLVEAYRLNDSLPALLERFAGATELSDEHRARWIELLREEGRADEAIELFTRAHEGEFDQEQRRELLELFRDAGRTERMLEEYRSLLQAEPRSVLWREGLARTYLEDGDVDSAREVWRPFVDAPVDGATLAGARALMGLGQDDLAIECAERAIADGRHAFEALLFLEGLHADRGRLTEAEAALERLDELAPPDHPVRMDLAEAFERLGKQARALDVYLGLAAARPGEEQGEDMAMRLAWLYSEVGREDEAMAAWLDLWRRVNSIPRRRYVEDRLMTVAARLGRLADVAIELEHKLAAGTADERESGLLVRLYTKVGDSVSATEVIEEFMQQTGGTEKDLLEEKARVYVACTDYARYEETVRSLIEIDPENEPDYLRQLAMSMLERGKPDEAREVLARLREVDRGSLGEEFEAGVLDLAGMHAEAARAYRIGLARHPERIDSLLLLAGVMKKMGQGPRAIAMFQERLENAREDDLFTIAVDGLLNMEASPEVLAWARRIVLERLAAEGDKMVLFQLYSDLSEELEDGKAQLTALENALPIAASRRPALLRELMDLAAQGQTADSDLNLAYGRRLIGLAEVVPPQVYLDLGAAFLNAGEIDDAARTFHLADEGPDTPRLQRQAAGLFDEHGFASMALDEYERVLISQATDVGLLVKVAELREQLGRDGEAFELYRRAMALILERRPLESGKAEEEVPANRWWGARNVDAYSQYRERILQGLLSTADEEGGAQLIQVEREAILADLAALAAGRGEGEPPSELARHPRLVARARLHRRLALAFGRVDEADQVDLQLLHAFPDDASILEEWVKERLDWGLLASARILLEESGRDEEVLRPLRFLVGQGSADDASQAVPLTEAVRLILPLVVRGDDENLRALLRRTDLANVTPLELGGMAALASAARLLDDPGALLTVGRQWVRHLFSKGQSAYTLEPILQRIGVGLPDAERLALYQYFTSLILEEPGKAANYFSLLPKLQSLFDEPLLSSEQIAELFDSYGEKGYGWGLGPVLELLPPEQRAGALRTVWGSVQPTQRAAFLLRLVGEMTQPVGEGLAAFIADVFPSTLSDADDSFLWSIDTLAEEREDLELAETLRKALVAQKPNDWRVRSLEWILEWRRGEVESAVAHAGDLFVDLLRAGGGDWVVNQARQRIQGELLPEHLGELLAAFDQATEGQGDPVDNLVRRLGLIRAAGDPARSLRATEEALERYPDEVELLLVQRDLLDQAGRPVDALAVVRHLTEVEPEKRQWWDELSQRWQRLGNPVAALEAFEKAESLEDEEAGSGSGIPGLPAGIILPPGATVIINGVAYTSGASTGSAGQDDPRHQKPATIQTLYEATQGEDADPQVARLLLRRLWRSFSKGEGQSGGTIFFATNFSRTAGLLWPGPPPGSESAEQEEKEETPEQRRLRMGGLLAFREEEPEPGAERASAWDVLAGLDWGADEIDRFVRTLGPGQFDAHQSLLEGQLRARLQRQDPKILRDHLLDEIAVGGGGRVQQIWLLSLLGEHPELANERVREVLDALVRAANPLDGPQVQRLARTYLQEGDEEEAVRLYRWCATQASSVWVYQADGMRPLSARALVREAKKRLEGASRDAVIDAVLKYADPGNLPWQRESFETLALSVWREIFGPRAAFERGRAMCEAAIDPEQGLRRGTARLAAGLFAAQGELPSAFKALEFALTKMDPADFRLDNPWMSYTVENFGYLGESDLRALFPRESDYEWPAVEWYRGAGERLLAWLAEERVDEPVAVYAVALITRRLVALGEQSAARELAAALVARESEGSPSPDLLLWVIDAAREAGLEEEAFGIERELFTSGRLLPARMAPFLARIREREGPEVARRLGEQAAETSLGEELLEELARTCEAQGDEEAAATWRARSEEARAAEKALEEARKAAKEAARKN